MKKLQLLLLFSALFLFACGPSPSNDLQGLEYDIKNFKKSENYKEFWKLIQLLEDVKPELSNEDFVIAHKHEIFRLLEGLGVNSLECYKKLADLADRAKNEKVKNHFYNRAKVYTAVGEFWAIEWDEYLAGKRSLPSIGQMVDDALKQKDYYNTELLQLKSET